MPTNSLVMYGEYEMMEDVLKWRVLRNGIGDVRDEIKNSTN